MAKGGDMADNKKNVGSYAVKVPPEKEVKNDFNTILSSKNENELKEIKTKIIEKRSKGNKNYDAKYDEAYIKYYYNTLTSDERKKFDAKWVSIKIESEQIKVDKNTLEEAKNDINSFLNAMRQETAVPIFIKIDTKSKENKVYNAAIQEVLANLTPEEKKRFDNKWNEIAQNQITKEAKSILDKLREKGVKNIDFYISADGSKYSVRWDSFLRVEMENGKTYWVGIKGVNYPNYDYGYSYEILGISNQKEKERIEQELQLKDVLAGYTSRIAQYRYLFIGQDKSRYLFISPESGTATYLDQIREEDGSTTFQIQGSPSQFNLLLEKFKTDKEFLKYTGYWETISALGLVNNIYAIQEMTGAQTMLTNGDMKVQISSGGKARTEIYKGGTIKIDENNYIAVSAPFIELNKDTGQPQMLVLIYKLDKNKNQIGVERLPVTEEKSINIKDTSFNIIVTPSESAMQQVLNQLYSQTYRINIGGSVLVVNPRINNKATWYDPKTGTNYDVILNSINPVLPLTSSQLKLQGQIAIINKSTSQAVTITADMGTETSIKIGDNVFSLKLLAPENMLITNNSEYVHTRFNLNTTEVTAQEGKSYYINTVSGEMTSKNPIFKGDVHTNLKMIFLSDSKLIPESEVEKKQKELPTSYKDYEKTQEKILQLEAERTATAFNIENLIGSSFDMYNGTGQGIWGVYYDPTKLIKKGITFSGEALKQLTGKFKKIGPDSLALTGVTGYEQEQLIEGDKGVESIKDVVGLGLWLALDTIALHGEGKVVNEKIKKELDYMTRLWMKGTKTEAVFSAFDPNREGFQVLYLNYSKEEKGAKEAGGPSVDIKNVNYSTSFGYRKNLQSDVINSIYGKLDLGGYENVNKYIFAGPGGVFNEQYVDTISKNWKPTFGVSTSKGAYEAYYNKVDRETENIISANGFESSSKSIFNKYGYGILAKGVPLFLSGLEFDASADYSKEETKTYTQKVLSSLWVYENSIISVAPILRKGNTTYFASITWEFSSSEDFKNATSKVQRKGTKIQTGIKNKWLGLDIFYRTDKSDSYNETYKSIQVGLNASAEITKDLSGFLNTNYNWNKLSGSYWTIYAGFRVNLGGGGKQPIKNQ